LPSPSHLRIFAMRPAIGATLRPFGSFRHAAQKAELAR